jgi:hypothetical protein
MSQTRRRQPKYRHVVPALVLMTTVVVAMAGITVSRLARIPANSVSVRLVGVQSAEASNDGSARKAAARDAATRAKAAAAVSARAKAIVEAPASASVADAAPAPVVNVESPTLPLTPGTLMVGLAAARSRTKAAAMPRPTPVCVAPVGVENYDADISGMTGLPGRKIYYARKQKNTLAAACRDGAQVPTSTP